MLRELLPAQQLLVQPRGLGLLILLSFCSSVHSFTPSNQALCQSRVRISSSSGHSVGFPASPPRQSRMRNTRRFAAPPENERDEGALIPARGEPENRRSSSSAPRGDDPSSARAASSSSGEREIKLLLSLLIDLVGYASFGIPGVGEVGDIGWAPVSGILITYLYGNALLGGLGFIEELLPGADFIPTATIGWLITYYGQSSPEQGETATDSSAPSRRGAIDIDATDDFK